MDKFMRQGKEGEAFEHYQVLLFSIALGLTQLHYSGSQRRAFCLRQHGTCPSSVCGFSALRAEEPHTIEKYRSAEGSTRQLRKSYAYWMTLNTSEADSPLLENSLRYQAHASQRISTMPILDLSIVVSDGKQPLL